ncbi:hypothetical protein MNB_SV-15-170 [hydrothermal vent metagenome]|uniref:SH3b domain-containing protein n=1 Tax=hydrothermal vent metagenome TaxID=652676 RepID=A0A1W1EL84_9ZZZZ
MKTLLKLSLLFAVTFVYGESYRVVDIRSDDTLSVRVDAGLSYRKIDELPYNARNIKVIRCKFDYYDREWCKVRHPSIYTGWVSARYIAPQYNSYNSSYDLEERRTSRAKRYRVVNIRSDDTLNVRSDAGVYNRKIDELYYRAKNIKVIRCKYTPRGSRWCKVSHPSIYTGWVSAKYIREMR